MKLVIIILTTCLLQVSAASFGQKVTLYEKDVPLKLVLRKIRQQTGYDILYRDKVMSDAKKVTINITDSPLEDALDKILKNQNLTYTITDKTIVINEKAPTFLERLADRWVAIDVHGRVVDQEGNPLSGATVKVKGTGKSVSTNGKGEFYLEKVEEDAVLVISFIGYVNKEIDAAKEIGDVVLELSNSKLDEVQVIAYGTTSQRLNTGSVTTIRAEDITKQPVNNPLLALQGRVPGLTISQTSGIPGAGLKVQLRGRNGNRFNAGSESLPSNPNEPLYILDGIPIDPNVPGGPSSLPSIGSVKEGTASAFSFLNPSDIESISILRDGDATSIYGSRGSNGVIIITTKRGKAGPSRINFNASSGLGRVTSKIELLNRRQYLDMRYEAYRNEGLDWRDPAVFPPARDLVQWDTTRYTDWQKELIGGTAKYNNAQVSASGGTENIQYLVSGNYYKETSVSPGDFSNSKGGVHFGLTGISTNQKLKLDFKSSFLADKNTLPGYDFTNYALILSPVAPPLYDGLGQLNWQTGFNNPLQEIYKQYEFNNINLTANLDIGYKLLNGLDLRINTGYNQLNGKSYQGIPFAAQNPASWNNPMNRVAKFQNTFSRSINVEPQMTFVKVLGKLTLNTIIGGSVQQNFTENQGLEVRGFDNDVQIKHISFGTSVGASEASGKYKYAAVFGRANINFDETYLLNISARRDGSSRFGPGNQFGNFASVGTALIFSNYNWIKKNLGFLSFGKLRGSYGTTGNDGVPDYGYMELYVYTYLTYQGAKGLKNISGIVNPYYAWETVKKLELALETGFFKDRLFLQGAYYRNRTSNQLVGYNFPSFVGPGSPVINQDALIQNSGFEFTLNSTNLQLTNFKWNTSINLSLNRNKLIKFPGIETSPLYLQVIGKPISRIATYHFIDADPETGKYRFANKDGKAVFSSDLTGDDRISYIDLQPKYFGGISNSVSFKGITIDFTFQFVKQIGKNYLYNSPLPPGFITNNQLTTVLNRWQKAGDKTTIQRYAASFDFYDSTSKASLESDQSYSDASFIRLKNLNVTYNIAQLFKSRVIQNLKCFLQGQNLWTISNYKGLDPETQGLGLPPLKIITLGIQAQF
nr:SusC/RagA family TonB-linked outer membrane protein [uncultured Pedobacter sp.]